MGTGTVYCFVKWIGTRTESECRRSNVVEAIGETHEEMITALQDMTRSMLEYIEKNFGSPPSYDRTPVSLTLVMPARCHTSAGLTSASSDTRVTAASDYA